MEFFKRRGTKPASSDTLAHPGRTETFKHLSLRTVTAQLFGVLSLVSIFCLWWLESRGRQTGEGSEGQTIHSALPDDGGTVCPLSRFLVERSCLITPCIYVAVASNVVDYRAPRRCTAPPIALLILPAPHHHSQDFLR